MTADEMMPKLEAWHAAMVEMDRQYDALLALTGMGFEWPLPAAICQLQDVATRAVAENVGDMGRWLEHFRLARDKGIIRLSDSRDIVTINGKKYPIRTLKQLARVIVADNREDARK